MIESTPAVEAPPFPLDVGLVDDVEAALEAAIRRNDAATARLRMTIERCAVALREQGMTAENVLITMRAFVRHSAAAHPPVGMPREHWSADAWLTDIIHWSLVEYFRHE